MQPHSMCTLALGNIVWNRHMTPSFCRLRVQYHTPQGNIKNNYYDLSSIKADKESLSVAIKRSGGGLACTMNARKDSSNRVKMTHETQHVAGLTEEFWLEKKEIKGGRHRNSLRYRDFSGSIKYDGEVIQLSCEVLNPKTHQFVRIPYTLSVDTLKF